MNKESFTYYVIELVNRSVRVHAQKLADKEPEKFRVMQRSLLEAKFPFIQVCHVRNGSSSIQVNFIHNKSHNTNIYDIFL